MCTLVIAIRLNNPLCDCDICVHVLQLMSETESKNRIAAWKSHQCPVYCDQKKELHQFYRLF